MCVWKEKWFHFWCEEEREEKKGKYIIQFHSKETKRESKADFTRMTKEGQDSFPFVWRWGGGGLQRKEWKKKERRMESVTNISETAKREANNRNNESEPRNPSPYFSRGVTMTDSLLIKPKESWREESTCEPWGRTDILDLTTRQK